MADIEVTKNGPYAVRGLELIRLRLQPADESQSQDWVERAAIDTTGEADPDGTYWLCRCGHSENKPFCDGHHKKVGFDGTETAATGTHRERAEVMEGEGVVVRDVRPLCAHATFCVADGSDVWKMVKSDDPAVLEAMSGMVDRCPSGALTRAATPEATTDVEPRLPLRVAVTDDGPLVVTGGAQVELADGTCYEVRNRMALCRCGASKNKPFCDGSHADPGVAFTDS
jgi:CDGSH-type Zn-finger protein